ncbi:hypothetical protein B0H10DRAFT_1959712 [Mycena sp. CBHHK59/15]|nr:hypothetical protein B0H10DRAFT_1959712 [Mycena sp. CBHHK59/15]
MPGDTRATSYAGLLGSRRVVSNSGTRCYRDYGKPLTKEWGEPMNAGTPDVLFSVELGAGALGASLIRYHRHLPLSHGDFCWSRRDKVRLAVVNGSGSGFAPGVAPKGDPHTRVAYELGSVVSHAFAQSSTCTLHTINQCTFAIDWLRKSQNMTVHFFLVPKLKELINRA